MFRRPPPPEKRSDAWSQALRAHEALAERSGLPTHILEDRQRFGVFLEHGYDETAWLAARKARAKGSRTVDVFNSRALSDEQLGALADLAQALFNHDRYRERILSRWQRG